MVNPDAKLGLDCLKMQTLQARHFADDLGLAKSRLHTWLAAANMDEGERPSGKWREFSPFEVFTLTAIAALKRATDLAISRHPELITFLSSRLRCGEAAISIWLNGLTPALITDLWKKHAIVTVEDSAANFPNLLSPNVTTILMLSPIVEFTFEAIQIGGNATQKSVIDHLRGYRERALETILQDTGKPVDSDFSPTLHALVSGNRKVDMSE